jgi:carboxyl-terminal processing protease
VRVGDLLSHGRQLEMERRWGEALAHYEDAIRQYPEDLGLHRRFDSTRLHYDLARRLNDRSYRSMLVRVSAEDALAQYSEVLTKIRAHYVEPPDWKELVQRGLNDLEIALGEPEFRLACRLSGDPQAVDIFREEVRQLLSARAIGSRSDACDAAMAVAGLAAQRLGIPAASTVLEFTCGAAGTLDPYSTYLTPDQLTEVYSQIEGNFVGLGVELKAHGDTLLIVRVIGGSPADRSGIRAGERIVAVDGRLTHDLSADRAANLLQGPAGSTVQLTVANANDENRPVTVRRERVEVPSVDEARILDPGQGIGYLRMTCFQKTTPHDLDAALWTLHQQGMHSLIIDLRGNPGGLLVASVEVANRFVNRGVIVSTRGPNFQEDLTYTAHETSIWHVPLVVLVDQDSASAAEIFAGAIRDHHRGTIVGRRSYGKGSVQGIFPLVAGGGVRLTTAKFFSPSGRPFNRVGVEPDIVVGKDATVRQTAKPLATLDRFPNTSTDPILSTALEAAQQLTGHAQR